jgi:hypothetical protein
MRIHTQSISIAFLAALLGMSIACSKPSDNTITKDVQTKVAADPDTKDDVTGKICTRWNERESIWRKSGSCRSKGTSQSKS